MNVCDAREQHQALLGRLMHGPGDSEGAMHRAERMFGLGFWPQWNLRHKRRASAEFMERVRQAYLSMLETSVRKDLERLKAEQLKGGTNDTTESLLAEAQDLLARIAAKREA